MGWLLAADVPPAWSVMPPDSPLRGILCPPARPRQIGGLPLWPPSCRVWGCLPAAGSLLLQCAAAHLCSQLRVCCSLGSFCLLCFLMVSGGEPWGSTPLPCPPPLPLFFSHLPHLIPSPPASLTHPPSAHFIHSHCPSSFQLPPQLWLPPIAPWDHGTWLGRADGDPDRVLGPLGGSVPQEGALGAQPPLSSPCRCGTAQMRSR